MLIMISVWAEEHGRTNSKIFYATALAISCDAYLTYACKNILSPYPLTHSRLQEINSTTMGPDVILQVTSLEVFGVFTTWLYQGMLSGSSSTPSRLFLR
jgi:hypothetical protein